MFVYINLKGIIQFIEIWLNLTIQNASLSALTLNTEPYAVGVFVLTKNKHDLNQWSWQGSTVGLSLYYSCLVKIQVLYNTQPECCMAKCIYLHISYSCAKFALTSVSNLVLNPAFVWLSQNSERFPLIQIIILLFMVKSKNMCFDILLYAY